MKSVRIISISLGISVFTFGVLKFFNPFKGWYSVQIMTSGLSKFSYWLGIAGEIFAGALFLVSMILRRRLPQRIFRFAIMTASIAVIVMMVMAIIVHLNPNVPANVLPLKIKPPIIPALFLLLGFLNIMLVARSAKR
ncbi:MAG TPA: hypothetical protein VHC47_14995 [Mucilaginibacter sp.]|nr:hypothetical protein [Mucilaginibacter sp.]